jgi:adenylate kinase
MWREKGICGRPAFHFDFGAELRAAAAAEDRLDPESLAIVRGALRTGALLEDAQFPIALGILVAFIRKWNVGERGVLVLNGLPRHAGQARDLEPYVDVRALVCLRAEADVLRTRIRGNVAGDRTGRPDDDPDSVASRLRLFEARTAPLESYYRERGVPVLAVAVETETTPTEIVFRLQGDLEALFGDRSLR